MSKGESPRGCPSCLGRIFGCNLFHFSVKKCKKGAYSQKQAAKGEPEVRMGGVRVSSAGLGTGVPSCSGDTLQPPSTDHPDCWEVGEGQRLALGG